MDAEERTGFYEDPQMPVRYGIFDLDRCLFQCPRLQGRTSREVYGRFVRLHTIKSRKGHFEARRVYPNSKYLIWIDTFGYGTKTLSELGGFVE